MMIHKKIYSKIRPVGKRIGIIAFGWFVNDMIIDNLFDYVLYPYVIWKSGILWGGLVMMGLSFFACYVSILFYDWMKIDWLGIESFKSLKEYSGKSIFSKLISWALKRGEIFSFIFLSIYFDPFMTLVYMRHGSHKYNNFKKRDWNILIVSTIICNVYWTTVAYFGISIIQLIFKNF